MPDHSRELAPYTPRLAIPTPGGEPTLVDVGAGRVTVFVGANGSGKTRLGVYMEGLTANRMAVGLPQGFEVHRVSARRDLAVGPVALVPLEQAQTELRYGVAVNAASAAAHATHYKLTNRWGNNPAVQQLNDFDHLRKVLFAEHVREAVEFKERHRLDPAARQRPSRLERLLEIWQSVLPHRRLRVLETRLVASDAAGPAAPHPPPDREYDAAQLSDGERVVFYLVGQVLAAPRGAALVVDEPEVHVHRTVAAALWDRLEAERRDLAFVYLTHDLDFATSRRGARKVALLGYTSPAPGTEAWTLRDLPASDDGFDEELAARVLGSRKPVLFVEGAAGSLDVAVYRRVYAEWTVLPLGGCEHVLHAVVSFNANGALHRLRCAGVVDGDNCPQEGDHRRLAARGVFALPVAEIENLFVLPPVVRVLAHYLGWRGDDLARVVREVGDAVLARAAAGAEAACARRVRRTIDAKLKVVGLGGPGAVEEIERLWADAVSRISVRELADAARAEYRAALDARDVARVLALCDDKGLLAEAARALGSKKSSLEERILGLLSSTTDRRLLWALRGVLPRPEVVESNAFGMLPDTARRAPQTPA